MLRWQKTNENGQRRILERGLSIWCVGAIALIPLGGDARPLISRSIAQQQASSAGEPRPQPASALTRIYRVGPEDALEIRLLNDPEAQPDYRVSPGGYIFFPYIGNVHVAGKTTSEIEEELKRLLKSGYFENPEVIVAVKEYKSHYVYLLGETGGGQIVLKREQVPLIEILAQAGVRPSVRRVIITRLGDESGQPSTLTVNLNSPEKYSVMVQHGDIIEVEALVERVFITGEVRQPTAQEYTPGLTLSQAIIQAGGPTEFAKRSKIEIKRKAPDGTVTVLRADFDKILRGESPDIELQPGDLIYVHRRFF